MVVIMLMIMIIVTMNKYSDNDANGYYDGNIDNDVLMIMMVVVVVIIRTFIEINYSS